MAPKKKSPEEVRRLKKECERRRRARIKENPELYELTKAKERERWLKRKQSRKVPSIKDLTPRSQRIQRKKWREQTKLSRDRKKIREKLLQRLDEDTPSETSESDSDHANRNPQILNVNNDDQNLEAPDLRNQRSSSLSSSVEGSLRSITPSSTASTKQRLAGAKTARRHRNMRNYIISKQKQTIQEMKKRIQNMAKKYNRLLRAKSVTTYTRSSKMIHQQRKTAIREFLEKDENSKACPGKKDCITRKKIKRQKRYLCDNLKRLHDKFNSSHSVRLRVSYQTFCRLKPFWILSPNINERDTCLCVMHENTRLVVEKLKREKIITEKSIEEVCNSVICAQKTYECYHRTCGLCSHKNPCFLTFESVPITYKQWVTKKEIRIIKGKEKLVQRTIKEEQTCEKIELVKTFMLLVDKFLVHQHNIFHQYRAIDHLKATLSEGEALFHVDFSENYQTKYTAEAQSVHFGASRDQISLHTGIIYYKNSDKLNKLCFCSASSCLRHDASAIYAHLMCVMGNFIKDHPVKVIHMLSDGPSNQYRNKKMMYLFSQHLVKTLALTTATWNFSEAGHGKGAPDGVGAVIKRTADNLVAQGTDIPNLKIFLTLLDKHIHGVSIYNVEEKEILNADKLLPCKLKAILGTLKVHQYTWSIKSPTTIYLRELTCTECSAESKCLHFGFKAVHKFVTNIPSAEQDPGPSSSSPSSIPSGQTVDKVNTGNWVVVKFCGEKSKTPIHFVGQVLHIENDGPAVKFTRKKSSSAGSVTFIWQEPEDISVIDFKDIECVLPEPTPSRRSELIFHHDFKFFNIK